MPKLWKTSNSGGQTAMPEPVECPPGVHSIFDPCPGDCADLLPDDDAELAKAPDGHPVVVAARDYPHVEGDCLGERCFCICPECWPGDGSPFPRNG